MAKTFHVATGDLEHGIEFNEENGFKAVLTMSKGKRFHIRFCSTRPPRRINALTLLDGEIRNGTICNESSDSNIILVHIVGAKEIKPNSSNVIIHGNEIALVQLVPGTGVTVHGKDKKFFLSFERGQLVRKAA